MCLPRNPYAAMARAAERQDEIQREAFAQMQAEYERGLSKPMLPRRAPRRPTKCEACGSREFKEHHGQRVCIYCRSNA